MNVTANSFQWQIDESARENAVRRTDVKGEGKAGKEVGKTKGQKSGEGGIL